jgi:hypothetical protein
VFDWVEAETEATVPGNAGQGNIESPVSLAQTTEPSGAMPKDRAQTFTEDLTVYRKRLLRDGATYDQSTVAPLTLPILTNENINDEADWHFYVRRIYGNSVTYPINLNDFTWFYWFAPIRLDRILLCV